MSTPIEFEKLQNVRDLGGMLTADGRLVRRGRLYRSGQLFFATEADKTQLDAMGIGKVFDFRSFAERDEKPDPDISGTENVHLPILKDMRTGITRGREGDESVLSMIRSGNVGEALVDKHMQNMYREFVTEPHANAQYARFVDETIAEAQRGKAALWHCTAGKDRAGFATLVVLEAIGVSRDDIVVDYMKTNACLAESIDSLIGQYTKKLPSKNALKALRRFFMADESYVLAAYEAIEEHFGSNEAFLEKALGIDAAKREVMKGLFLEA